MTGPAVDFDPDLDALDEALTTLAELSVLDPAERLAKIHAEVWPAVERTTQALRRIALEARALAAAELWHDGKSHREIAELLDIPRPTAQAMVTEGRNLPAFIAKHGEPTAAQANARRGRRGAARDEAGRFEPKETPCG